ncbi:MAG: helix-turn-helix domain-containing protein [Nanoarchaeota archaeon]|nr:helix-turn-helix domain-containing protein [Nanoarchaeota archaeon]MBU1321381.1 helix-turn-helix domain-containing protein [Nanoarchaeota archaeon]MBU1597441.1 helix-turn-helix domain-containing protein [Nanoarchaeota archaeon]MBU2441353.1 helix-turn-helix domain-containing protein [Nanoarchaeota archaeon]
MEQETLFTASKWDILKILASGNKSPIQLAKLSNTSVANISQQLRLLEMAGLVQSKRISNRDKGQPRLLYSLAGNHSFLIATSQDFVEKKFHKLSLYNKIILKIWFLDNPELHYYLEKAFWHVEDHLQKIDAILYNMNNTEDIGLVLVSNDSKLKKELKKLSIKNPEGVSKTVFFDIKSKLEIQKQPDSVTSGLYALYDPSNMIVPGKEEVEVKIKDKN